MPGAGHFDEIADDYARGRPGYPPPLWAWLAGRGLLRRGASAVDLGAGTGQATGPLLDAGLEVLAVEPGRLLAERLRAAHPGADVVVARAEELDVRDDTIDLAVAATSVHWMDLATVVPLVHRALSRDGRWVVMRHVFGDPDVATPFRDRVEKIAAARDVGLRTGAAGGDLATTAAALTTSGHFVVDGDTEVTWQADLDTEAARRLFTTFSDWSTQEVDQVAGAVTELGGTVVEHYRSWALVLRPVSSAD